MTDRRVKVGVVGVGSLGQWHARVYSELKSVQLIMVLDTNQARAAEIAGRYGARVCADLDEFAANVEAASVVVPTDRHWEVASRLIEKGVHLLVEKPIADSTERAEKLVRAAQERNLVLQVGHVERFNPVLEYLDQVLNQPRFIEAHRLAPYPPARGALPPRGTEVSVVLDLMIHDLEVILHLVKSEPAHIHAVGIPVLSGSEDIANARIAFASGCVANVTASRVSPEVMRKIRVFQPDAYISLDYKNQKGEIFHKTTLGIEKKEMPIRKSEPLYCELAAFVECVLNHGAPRVGGEEATRALRLAADIVKIIREQPG